MSETSFKRKVNSLVKVYNWSINDRLTAFIPDTWYSGPKGDLWIEYKYVELRISKTTLITPTKLKHPLSAGQERWLNDRHAEGRSVCVVVGLSLREGIIFTNGGWSGSKPRTEAVSIEQIAEFIHSKVGANDQTKQLGNRPPVHREPIED